MDVFETESDDLMQWFETHHNLCEMRSHNSFIFHSSRAICTWTYQTPYIVRINQRELFFPSTICLGLCIATASTAVESSEAHKYVKNNIKTNHRRRRTTTGDETDARLKSQQWIYSNYSWPPYASRWVYNHKGKDDKFTLTWRHISIIIITIIICH